MIITRAFAEKWTNLTVMSHVELPILDSLKVPKVPFQPAGFHVMDCVEMEGELIKSNTVAIPNPWSSASVRWRAKCEHSGNRLNSTRNMRVHHGAGVVSANLETSPRETSCLIPKQRRWAT